jgi:hypothetical protein
MVRFFHIVAILAACAVLPPGARAADADSAKAIALFKAAFAGRCADKAFTDEYLSGTEGIAFTYKPSPPSDEPEQKEVLYQFFCDNYAHAGSAAFILKDHDGKFQVLSFASPHVKYTSDPNADDGLRNDGVTGFESSDLLMNAEFDPETKTIATDNFEGDQSYYETYVFEDEMFVFTGDQSYLFEGGILKKRPPETEQ